MLRSAIGYSNHSTRPSRWASGWDWRYVAPLPRHTEVVYWGFRMTRMGQRSSSSCRFRAEHMARTPDGQVFVVDDDLSMREALAALIASAGLKTELFASAADFLRHSRPIIP